MGQFEEFDSTRPMVCAVCEAMCPEAVDGTLTAAEQQAFEKHVAGCVACAEELAQAKRGAAWMAMLKGHAPEPPAALLQRILAETTGAVAGASVAPAFAETAESTPLFHDESVHGWAIQGRKGWGAQAASGWSTQWASLRTKLSGMFSAETMSFQPRLAMTAAMAFFSVALTLNISGVRVSDLRAGLLRPSTLRRTFADAGASATRSFQNLRVVYEVESRVSDLRNSGALGDKFNDEQRRFESTPGPTDSNQKDTAPKDAPDQNKPEKSVPQGKSELEFPRAMGPAVRKGA
jgi:hypothetical protein